MSDQRDVVLVTVDSLRADHCGYAGYEEATTPTLDALASEGLVFENAIAPAAATSGSAFSFFTGEYPIARPTETSRRGELRGHAGARDTIAERFSRRGYETIGITANPWTSRFFSFDKGFDRFEDFMDTDASSDIKRRKGSQSTLVSLLVQFVNWWQGQNMYMSWEAIFDDIRSAIDEADSPYFLWVFLVDVHMPYLPGPGYRSQSRLLTYPANAWLYADVSTPFESRIREILLTAYDDTIRYTDEFLRRLALEFDASGSDPLLLFHADHGEEFGEHGFYGHGKHLYEGIINVPLVVANGPTGRIEQPFPLLNLPDLVLSLAADEGYEDLLGPYARSRNYAGKRAVRGDGWKYITAEDGEDLLRIEGGEETQFVDDDLLSVGRDIVTAWKEAETERQRIIRASGDLQVGEL